MNLQNLAMSGLDPDASPSFLPLTKDRGEEIELSMQEILLTGIVQPTGARLLVRHTFVPGGDRPVELVYAMVLPRDGALRRFRVVGQGFDAKSELRSVEQARQLYERGIEQGHLSVLAQQYRDGYVNLDVGNVRPGERVTVYLELLAGVELYDDGFRFRFPFTVAPCYHPRMRAAALDSETGELELPEDEFGDLVLPPFKRDASDLHSTGFNLLLSLPHDIAKIESPSHAIHVGMVDSRRARVSLAVDRDIPNRDLVLDARMNSSFAGVVCGTAQDNRMHFAAIVASDRFGKPDSTPRRMVFLVDRSGSMSGLPLEQVKNAVLACLAALSEKDLVGVVAFDHYVEVYDAHLVAADRPTRRKLRKFVERLYARGGTELLNGIETAVQILGDEGGDILVLTDGQVFGTDAIIQGAKASKVRVHCLGIGSASQDRFLAQLAKETGGTSRFLTPRERVDRAALELFASIGKPVATNLRVWMNGALDCTIAPEPPRVVHHGHPLVVFGECHPSIGELVIEWFEHGQSRSISLPVDVQPTTDGDTLRLLRGARLIADLEYRVVPELEFGSGDRRKNRRAERLLKKLGRQYGLANRYLALVAVVERAGDQKGALPETRVVPVGLPEDVSFGAYFLCQPPTSTPATSFSSNVLILEDVAFGAKVLAADIPALEDHQLASSIAPQLPCHMTSFPGLRDRMELAVRLAGLLEPDGGMPGGSDEERLVASFVVLMFLVEQGHRRGPLRLHVEKLLQFVENNKAVQALRTIATIESEEGCSLNQFKPVLRQLRLLRPVHAELEELLRSIETASEPHAGFDELRRVAQLRVRGLEQVLSELNQGHPIPGDWTALAVRFLEENRIPLDEAWNVLDSALKSFG